MLWSSHRGSSPNAQDRAKGFRFGTFACCLKIAFYSGGLAEALLKEESLPTEGRRPGNLITGFLWGDLKQMAAQDDRFSCFPYFCTPGHWLHLPFFLQQYLSPWHLNNMGNKFQWQPCTLINGNKLQLSLFSCINAPKQHTAVII